MRSILSLVHFCVGIILSLLIGKLLAYFVGVLPASLYGMLIFCVLLSGGLINPEKVARYANFSFVWMPLVFLPICVGVMEHSDLLKEYGLIVLVSGLVALLLTLASVGFCSQMFLSRIYGEKFPTQISQTDQSSE